MSCSCQPQGDSGPARACPCDEFVHPPGLRIDAGLSRLPRQIAGFPEFRRAMLHAVRAQPGLGAWRARGEDDLGVMLLEMWAYVCDVLSFYDEVMAQEAYVRTANRRPSLRRLVALLGYLPAPAVGAVATLAAIAEGRQSVVLPKGAAFRSGGFDGNPPQVFELDSDTVIHPLTNQWSLQAPNPGRVSRPDPPSFLVELQAEIKPGALLLLRDLSRQAQNQAVRADRVEPYTGADGRSYNRLTLAASTQLAAGTSLAGLRLLQPAQSAPLWTLPGNAKAVSDDRLSLTLNSAYPSIQSGEYILVTRGSEARWFRVTQVDEVMRQTVAGRTVTVNGTGFEVPGSETPVTRIRLDTSLNAAGRKASGRAAWTNDDRSRLRVHFNLQTAAQPVSEPKTLLSPGDPLRFTRRAERPVEEVQPLEFLLQDKNQRGALIGAELNFDTNSLSLNQGESWTPGLVTPVEAFGNVIHVSRGEQVNAEILGSGNASLANQSFKLKKKPLTYLFAPDASNDRGVKSTLSIYVNGVRWTEAGSFYGKSPVDQVYIVRQNDEGDSQVTFGDGIRGERLPSGRDNIVAYYRFGGGQAAPPAGSLSQIARPVKGLKNVNNPLPATGGADAEPAEALRFNAPKSALILGRAVSIADMEAVALAMPGVRSVQAEWRWHGQKQRTVVHLWYIGEAGIEEKLLNRLRSVSDPSTPLQVEAARAKTGRLIVDVVLDPRYLEADVLAALREKLAAPVTGLLAPERLGIGRPLFRSRLFEAALSVEGVTAVRHLAGSGDAFPSRVSLLTSNYAVTPGAGRYFDLELVLKGKNN